MLQWFQRLMPRQAQFYPLFERHAAVVVAASSSLRAMLLGGDHTKVRCQEVLALEHEADAIAREVLISLRTTFITQGDGRFDRPNAADRQGDHAVRGHDV